MSFLEKLRSKPSHVKAQIAFWSAAGIAGLIGIVWVTTLPAQLSREAIVEDENQRSQENSSSISFQGIRDAFKKVGNQVGSAWTAVKVERGPRSQEDEAGSNVETSSNTTSESEGPETTNEGMFTLQNDAERPLDQEEGTPEPQATTTATSSIAAPTPTPESTPRRVILIGTSTSQAGD